MSRAPRRFRGFAGVIGIALAIVLALATIRPDASAAEQTELAQTFGFEQILINEAPLNPAFEREVAPDLHHIRGWISAVGAAVGLADLRGNGRPADACLVDPRDDSLTLRAVPGSGTPDYAPVVLRPEGLPYDHTMAPMGCVPADINSDGSTDIIAYYWGRSPVMFLRTGSNPTAVPTAADFRPVEMVTPMQVWNTTALSTADGDGDGHLDVMVGNYFPDGARVLDPASPGETRMQMQASMGMAHNAGANRLFITEPTGRAGAPPRLTDLSHAFPEESARSWTLAFGAQDLTGDLLPEIYVANDFGPDQMLVNNSSPGSPRFETVRGDRDLLTPRSHALGHDSFKGMGVTYSYEPDETLPRIAVSNITSDYALHESNFLFSPHGDGRTLLAGELPYTDRAEEKGMARSGWSWDIKAGDFDNSGHDEFLQTVGFLRGETDRWPLLQELAMGNDQLLHLTGAWPVFGAGDDLSGHEHNPLWVRRHDGTMTDLAPALGLTADEPSRGIALGDIDGDGRLDALVAKQWADSTVLRNTGDARPAAFLRLLRPGAVPGVMVDAVGASVEWASGSQTHRTQLFPANGHAGVSAAQVHLPLPDGAPTTAVVRWTDGAGAHTRTVPVTPGHHTIVLDSGTATQR
ncbi:VCBS repeat-containing protein [Pseudonocardia sp. EV170527-09]|nr:VCBS repeat-containing protein [Pseudonocardia sp. EV170527-09]